MHINDTIQWMRNYGKGPLTNGKVERILIGTKQKQTQNTEQYIGEAVDYINLNEYKGPCWIIAKSNDNEMLWLEPKQIRG